MFLGDLEAGQQPQWPLSEVGSVWDLQLVRAELKAVFQLPDLSRLHRGVAARLTLLDHDLREARDGSRLSVVVAHEVLDRKLQIRAGLVARDRRGDLLLVLEAHLIGLPTTDQMQLVADTPEELEAFPVSLHLQLAQEPHVEQIVERPHQGLDRAGHPQRCVVIAQATDPLLQIRLQQVEGAAVFLDGAPSGPRPGRSRNLRASPGGRCELLR